MKLKIVIVILAVACIGLLIGLLSVKKQGEEQHALDASSIVDFSNQVVNADLKINDLNQVNLMLTNDLALSQQQAAQLSNSLSAAQATIAESRTTLASAQQQIANEQQQITNLNGHINDLEIQNKVLDQQASELSNTIAKLNLLIADTQGKLGQSESNSKVDTKYCASCDCSSRNPLSTGHSVTPWWPWVLHAEIRSNAEMPVALGRHPVGTLKSEVNERF